MDSLCFLRWTLTSVRFLQQRAHFLQCTNLVGLGVNPLFLEQRLWPGAHQPAPSPICPKVLLMSSICKSKRLYQTREEAGSHRTGISPQQCRWLHGELKAHPDSSIWALHEPGSSGREPFLGAHFWLIRLLSPPWPLPVDLHRCQMEEVVGGLACSSCSAHQVLRQMNGPLITHVRCLGTSLVGLPSG